VDDNEVRTTTITLRASMMRYLNTAKTINKIPHENFLLPLYSLENGVCEDKEKEQVSNNTHLIHVVLSGPTQLVVHSKNLTNCHQLK